MNKIPVTYHPTISHRLMNSVDGQCYKIIDSSIRQEIFSPVSKCFSCKKGKTFELRYNKNEWIEQLTSVLTS